MNDEDRAREVLNEAAFAAVISDLEETEYIFTRRLARLNLDELLDEEADEASPSIEERETRKKERSRERRLIESILFNIGQAKESLADAER